MPPPYKHHLFVCTNRREDGHPKGCCASKGSEQVLDTMKRKLAEKGLRGQARACSSSCLDACENGVSVVVYPEGVWYARVTPEDVEEILEQHVKGGAPVERLRMPAGQRTPKDPVKPSS
jgi:(2Fe-2S) ferredoxin